MKSIFESINNRELAFLIWVSLMALVLVFKASARKAAGHLLVMILWSQLTFFFLLVAVYSLGVAYFLWTIDLWDLSQVKNTVLWFFTAGAASLFHITDKDRSNYLKETIKDILSITAALQFFVSLYSFSLVIELLFVPFAFLIGGMTVVAGKNSESHQLTIILRKLVVFVGLTLIGYTLFKIIVDFRSFANKGTLSDFLIPAVLSFMFLPLLYLISIIVTHNDVFTGIKRRIKQPRLKRYARWKALINFHVNKTDLHRWLKLVFLYPMNTKDDVNKSIERIKEMKRKEKLSLPVTIEKGWSPYQAMIFLTAEEITTGYYQPSTDENEWIACSDYVKIDDNIPPANISYYVEGDADVATKLTLYLSVYNRKQDGFAITQFLQKLNLLFSSALQQPTPFQIEDSIINGKNLEMQVGNRRISIEKTFWENEKQGYYLQCIIETNKLKNFFLYSFFDSSF
jgi:hypothetical protein